MAINQIMNEHERLSILHCLAAMDGYAANNSIIQSVCQSYGNSMTQDKLGTHLHWLQEQGLVKLDQHESYTIATITQRGLDVERGLASSPGIKRPSPKV
ncbi:ArsR family transcriptional regulator [Neptunicella sp. SCSIO 80796]|uniref:VpaChn25_0724 family phage protein n=1 Tax=Neptunicella plasticusilytica TaxID=3117012 RepID=UPI003A4DF308